MTFRIIYTSAAIDPFSDRQITDLLGISRHNNLRDDIMGLMVYHDGNFFQVLEGPKIAVEGCFDRICHDSRHRGQICLWQGNTQGRAFPDWQMGFSRFSEIDEAHRNGMRPLDDLARAGNSAVRERIVALLLKSFLKSFRDLPTGGTG